MVKYFRLRRSSILCLDLIYRGQKIDLGVINNQNAMKQLLFFKLFALLIFMSSCAPAFKTSRLNNFSDEFPKGITSDMIKAQVALKQIVIVSYYDGKEAMRVPQYICHIDSLDDTYIYGKLEFANFNYHLSGDRNFEVRELKGKNPSDTAFYQTNPLEVLHIYMRFNNFKEGSCKLNINEIYSLDTHQGGLTTGGKFGVAGGILGAATVIGIGVAIIVFFGAIAAAL